MKIHGNPRKWMTILENQRKSLKIRKSRKSRKPRKSSQIEKIKKTEEPYQILEDRGNLENREDQSHSRKPIKPHADPAATHEECGL